MSEEGEVGRLCGNTEGIEKHRLAVTNSHGAVKCSPGNTVSTIVITVYGVRWALKYHGEHFVKYVTV